MIHPLIEYLLQQSDKRKERWGDLAERFNIRPDIESKYNRGEVARKMWKSFLKRKEFYGMDLVTVKEIYRNGKLLYETKKTIPSELPEIDYKDFEIEKVTTNPYGGKWIKYKKESGFSVEQIKQLGDEFEFRDFSSPKIENSSKGKIGIVDISDIHTGAIVRAFYESFKQAEFNSDILIGYLDNAADIINSYHFSEVYLFFPGDFIESFTGFNKRETYKNIEAHQGEVVLLAYQIMKRFLSKVHNVAKAFMVEGNHDRFTEKKENSSRKGVGEVIAYFLDEKGNVPIDYHPFIIGHEIDNIYHICTHGDYKPFKNTGYDSFFFKYGKQGVYNVLRTGHYHSFNILQHTPEFMHYQCPSIFSGGLFEETLGYQTLPGITILQKFNGIVGIDFRPVNNYYVSTTD